MWKIFKKILRTIALWLPLCCMIFNIYAVDDIETMPLHPYLTFRWASDTAQNCQVRAYNRLPTTQSIPGTGGSVYYRGTLVYQSALKKNTFYHMTLNYDTTSATDAWLEDKPTGVITDQGGEVTTVLCPASTLSAYLNDIDSSYREQTNKTITWSYNSMRTQNLSSYVGAKVYYYFTKNQGSVNIDVLFYFNDEFFDYGWNYDASHARYMQCYLGVIMPMAGDFKLTESKIYEVGGSDYNGKLDEIISLLQAQGGSISKEDIQAATLAALEQHDAAEEQKGNNKIKQIKQQIESITEPYKENLTSLQDATRSITASLNYSGTTAVLKLPEARNPMTNNSLLWEEKEIDLGYYWEQLPQALRSAITIILTFLILYKVIIEMVDEITWVIYMDKNVDKAERNAIGL